MFARWWPKGQKVLKNGNVLGLIIILSENHHPIVKADSFQGCRLKEAVRWGTLQTADDKDHGLLVKFRNCSQDRRLNVLFAGDGHRAAGPVRPVIRCHPRTSLISKSGVLTGLIRMMLSCYGAVGKLPGEALCPSQLASKLESGKTSRSEPFADKVGSSGDSNCHGCLSVQPIQNGGVSQRGRGLQARIKNSDQSERKS